jgi:hypothetical protein
MKKLVFVILSVMIVFSMIVQSAMARPQTTDYMACAVSENHNYVSILAIPQSYFTSDGREEAIAKRSCDSKMVKAGFGWMTEFDCSKQVKIMNQILRQLQSSGACPATYEE